MNQVNRSEGFGLTKEQRNVEWWVQGRGSGSGNGESVSESVSEGESEGGGE
jgi:hypothetical protein